MERKENQSGISQSGWQAACVTLSQVWRSAYANCRHGTFDFEQAQSSSFPLISFSSPASALCMWIVQHRWHSCFERNKIDLLLFSVLPSFLPSFLPCFLASFLLSSSFALLHTQFGARTITSFQPAAWGETWKYNRRPPRPTLPVPVVKERKKKMEKKKPARTVRFNKNASR